MEHDNGALTLEGALRAKLIAMGVTQVEIAEETGLAQSTAGRFLRGEVSIKMDTFEKLRAYVQRTEQLALAGLLPKKRGGPPRGVRKLREAQGEGQRP